MGPPSVQIEAQYNSNDDTFRVVWSAQFNVQPIGTNALLSISADIDPEGDLTFVSEEISSQFTRHSITRTNIPGSYEGGYVRTRAWVTDSFRRYNQSEVVLSDTVLLIKTAPTATPTVTPTPGPEATPTPIPDWLFLFKRTASEIYKILEN